MLPSDILLDTRTFALQTQRTNSSVRGDAAKDLDNPSTLTVAHETAKSGRVSSVIIVDSAAVVDCDASCNLTPTTDNIRVQFKVQYNPLSGRTDTGAEILAVKAVLEEFLSTPDLFDRFMNRET